MTDTATVLDQYEHVDVSSDRAIIRWWITGSQAFRGVTLRRVQDGKIVEALGYGKRS